MAKYIFDDTNSLEALEYLESTDYGELSHFKKLLETLRSSFYEYEALEVVDGEEEEPEEVLSSKKYE